jgi:hypothetical protein
MHKIHSATKSKDIMKVLPVSTTTLDSSRDAEGRITRTTTNKYADGSEVSIRETHSVEIESLERELELSHVKLEQLKEKEAFIGSRLKYYRLQLGDLVYIQHHPTGDSGSFKQQEDQRTSKEKSDFTMLRSISKSHEEMILVIEGLEKKIDDMQDHKMQLAIKSARSQEVIRRTPAKPFAALSISSCLLSVAGLFVISVPLMYCAGLSYQRQRESNGNMGCAFVGWVLYAMFLFTAFSLAFMDRNDFDVVHIVILSAVLGLISWIFMTIHAESARRY